MQNADQNELDKFSQLAHRWWDPHSEFRPLHEINPLRLGWIDAMAGGLAGLGDEAQRLVGRTDIRGEAALIADIG